VKEDGKDREISSLPAHSGKNSSPTIACVVEKKRLAEKKKNTLLEEKGAVENHKTGSCQGKRTPKGGGNHFPGERIPPASSDQKKRERKSTFEEEEGQDVAERET